MMRQQNVTATAGRVCLDAGTADYAVAFPLTALCE